MTYDFRNGSTDREQMDLLFHLNLSHTGKQMLWPLASQ